MEKEEREACLNNLMTLMGFIGPPQHLFLFVFVLFIVYVTWCICANKQMESTAENPINKGSTTSLLVTVLLRGADLSVKTYNEDN